MMEDDMIIYKDKNVQLREMMCEMKWRDLLSGTTSNTLPSETPDADQSGPVITVVTSEGRENATQRSDIGGRAAAGMTIEDSSSNTNTTNLREGLVSESNTTRLISLQRTKTGPVRRWPARDFVARRNRLVRRLRERAERDHRSDLMANWSN